MTDVRCVHVVHDPYVTAVSPYCYVLLFFVSAVCACTRGPTTGRLFSRLSASSSSVSVSIDILRFVRVAHTRRRIGPLGKRDFAGGPLLAFVRTDVVIFTIPKRFFFF